MRLQVARCSSRRPRRSCLGRPDFPVSTWYLRPKRCFATFFLIRPLMRYFMNPGANELNETILTTVAPSSVADSS